MSVHCGGLLSLITSRFHSPRRVIRGEDFEVNDDVELCIEFTWIAHKDRCCVSLQALFLWNFQKSLLSFSTIDSAIQSSIISRRCCAIIQDDDSAVILKTFRAAEGSTYFQQQPPYKRTIVSDYYRASTYIYLNVANQCSLEHGSIVKCAEYLAYRILFSTREFMFIVRARDSRSINNINGNNYEENVRALQFHSHFSRNFKECFQSIKCSTA